MENKSSNFTPFQKLDNVLQTLDHEDYYWSTIEDIINDVDFITDEREIRLITKRLLDDDFAESVPINPNEIENTITKYRPNLLYYVTFNGQIHLKEGGYIEKRKRETKAANLQLALTVAIATGTVLAGLYALAEFLKMLLRMFHCH